MNNINDKYMDKVTGIKVEAHVPEDIYDTFEAIVGGRLGYTLSIEVPSHEVSHLEALEAAIEILTSPEEVKPVRVIRNGPATIVFWSDGSKTVTKRHGDDEDNACAALLNCYWRKVEGNRGKSDSHYTANLLVGAIGNPMTPDELRMTARQLEFLADAKEAM